MFQIGVTALGFIGHPGIRRAMIEDLLMECDEGPPNAVDGLEAISRMRGVLDDALVPLMAGTVAATGWMEV